LVSEKETHMKKTLIAIALAVAPAIALAQGMGYGPGNGYGPGMGYGPGGGGRGGTMMGYGRGGLAALDLSDAQAEKIFAIQDAQHQKNWPTMTKMRSEMFKLRRMYYDDKSDPKAVAEQQKKVDELRRAMLQSRLESRKQIEAVLTPEQRKQLRQSGPWWLGDEE
jgi:Spy/CpxP family protein refolding chaperone